MDGGSSGCGDREPARLLLLVSSRSVGGPLNAVAERGASHTLRAIRAWLSGEPRGRAGSG